MPVHVRELRGVLEREGAEIGVLLTMNSPTREMEKEAATAGFYSSPWGRHPRLQILTVEQILAGKGIDYPGPMSTNVTVKRAQPSRRPRGETLPLPGFDGAPVPEVSAQKEAISEPAAKPGLASAKLRIPRKLAKAAPDAQDAAVMGRKRR